MLSARSARFAEQRLGEPADLRLGRRGIEHDEASAFLRAMDAQALTVDDAGYVVPVAFRPKPGGGRYSLISANTWGGDIYVSLNTEYLVHFGAVFGLVADWGWPAKDVLIEGGEFDATVEHSGRVVLAMEAKERVEGPDGLSKLFEAFVRFGRSEEPPEPVDNASRKYVELLRLCESGPVLLWLVASGARWGLRARRIDRRVELTVPPDINANRIDERGWTRHGESVGAKPAEKVPFSPSLEHAVEVARLTARDGAHRAYEYPWEDEHGLRDFAAQVTLELERVDVDHVRPWIWKTKTGGGPLTPCGRATGLELRFSYYA